MAPKKDTFAILHTVLKEYTLFSDFTLGKPSKKTRYFMTSTQKVGR